MTKPLTNKITRTLDSAGTKGKDATPTEATVIRLTKVKQFYLPVDAESYLVLRNAGIPLTRIHQDILPTIQLLTRQNNIKAKEVSFANEIVTPFLDRVGAEWLKGEHRSVTITAKTMRFETTNSKGLRSAEEAAPKLQACLERFFLRWGFRSTIEQSVHRNKCLIYVSYWLDANTQPVISLEQAATEIPAVTLTFGFTRLTLKLGPRECHLVVSTSQGGTFVPLHSTRCLYNQISDVRGMLTALLEIPSIDPTNPDNKSDA